MYGISRLYTSDDPSAPQLTRNDGSLNAVLKAVCVNGYGTTESLGWETIYELGNTLILRTSHGRRRYLKFTDDIFITPSNLTAVSSFSTMVDDNIGMEGLPMSSTESSMILKSTALNAGNIPWRIIGDEAGIYILIKSSFYYTTQLSHKHMWFVFYFGDYNPIDPANKWPFIHIPLVSNVYTYAAQSFIAGVLPFAYVCIERDPSYAVGGTNVSFLSMKSFQGTTPDITNQFNRVRVKLNPVSLEENKIGGSYVMNPIRIYCSTPTSGFSDAVLMGNLPGIYEPLVGVSSEVYNGDTVLPPQDDYTDINGNRFILITAKTHTGNQGTKASTFYVFRIGEGFRNVQ